MIKSSESFVTVKRYASGMEIHLFRGMTSTLLQTSAVRPWLMSLRGDLVKAKTVSSAHPFSTVVSFDWRVERRPEHRIEEKKSWVRCHAGGPPLPLPAVLVEHLARTRKEIIARMAI